MLFNIILCFKAEIAAHNAAVSTANTQSSIESRTLTAEPDAMAISVDVEGNHSDTLIDYDIAPTSIDAEVLINVALVDSAAEASSLNLNLSSVNESLTRSLAIQDSAAGDADTSNTGATEHDIFSTKTSTLFVRSADGRFTCSVGPDQLPGLRAWSLVSRIDKSAQLLHE